MNSHQHRFAAAIAAAATAAVVLMPAASAQAETTRVVDGRDATGSPSDILRVKVSHGPDQVRVRAKFADLRKRGAVSSGAAVFIDSNRARRGPEFAVITGLGYGTDYQLAKVRRWKLVGSPLSCDHKLRLDYKRDVMTFRASRSCFANPATVRVGMRMDDHADGSHVITDWMTGRRKFTGWLARA